MQEEDGVPGGAGREEYREDVQHGRVPGGVQHGSLPHVARLTAACSTAHCRIERLTAA